MRSDQARAGCGWRSVGEAAEIAGVSRQSVHQWIAQGRLQPIQTDDGYRIAGNDLDHFLAIRRAAFGAHVKVDTLLHWTAEVDSVEPG